MRIALLHYHLIRGGVSSVIRQQARSLVEAGEEVLVIAGEAVDVADAPVSDFGGAPLVLIPDLRYDSRRGNAGSSDRKSRADGGEELADAIQSAMEKRWGSMPDVLHIHNPLIRKNTLLMTAIRLLRGRGVKLLLQNHDFAEDFRSDVYHGEEGYPDDCHYAALNGRDFSFLKRAGLNVEGAHLLPNAVVPMTATPGLERTRYLYPVRAIRRKNLGEALLLSLFIPAGRTIAVTLPPNAARDEEPYLRWLQLAKRLGLPVEFGVGERESLPDLLGSSICAVSTSVKEGFGFSYLEPWTAGRAVIGRRLGYVCSDFEREGVRFEDSYESIDVPLAYLPAPLLRRKLEQALVDAYRSFGMTAPSYTLKMLTDDLFSRDVFDFGRLDEELQADIIETVALNDAAREDIVEANPFLGMLSYWVPNEPLIEKNRQRILASYSEEASLARLRDTYRKVSENPVRHHLSKSILLELFLDPLRLSLVGSS
ncbi:MAG: hypothetical protein A2Z99_09135 [Treponema sp. GWB1_62_6]|nr:MAG: hypothetical protein A2Z99_09135 [Treponema sp. GWB1_62_6]OHE70174.1 MAG: hypothetical protein A2001_06825 [Treponema sp. GWC1_61_84]HCM28445.1 hypothetical protein [Treponema sp.]